MIATPQIWQMQGLTFCVLAFLVTRAALMAVGVLAYDGQLPLPLGPHHASNVFFTRPWLDIWFAWDSNWYLSVLNEGYQSEAGGSLADPGTEQANWAFFPLYSLAGAVMSEVLGIGGKVSLLLVANLAFIGALYLVYLEARDLHEENIARLAVLLLVLWPGTHFFSSAYTESLFLLLAVATFRLARKKKFLAAAALAALATITRSPGIFLTLPIAFYAWANWLDARGRRHSVRSGFEFAFSRAGAATFAICCIPLMALGGFMWHLQSVTGDPFAFATVQSAWGRSLSNPIMEFVRPVMAPDTIPLGQWPDFIVMLLVPIPLVVLLRRSAWPHLSFALPLVVLAVTAGVVSLNRQILVILPLTIVTASLLASNKLLSRLFLFLAGTGAVMMMALWSAGYGIV